MFLGGVFCICLPESLAFFDVDVIAQGFALVKLARATDLERWIADLLFPL